MRHMEGQKTSDSDPHQGKLQKHLAFCTHPNVPFAHIPMYAGLGVISAYIREKGIKSRVQKIIGVFRDDLGNIKGTIIFHGVQRVYRGIGKAIKV